MTAARMLAVCDLLTDEPGHLDARRVVDGAAVQLARLTRAELGLVVAEGPQGLFVGSYPGSVSLTEIRGLFSRYRESGCTSATLFDGDLDARIAGFGERGGVHGIVVAAGPIDGQFSLLDEWLTTVVARRVEAQLSLVEMHQERIAAAEIVRDASLAGKLQRALMPPERYLSNTFDIAGRLRPARHVAGDLYDVIPAGDEAVAIVADVAGKGVAASLLTASVHAAAAHAVASVGAAPAEIVAAIDRQIAPLLDRTGRIITLAVAATDASRGQIRIANAGHHPILLCGPSGAELVSPGAPPLGIAHFAMDEAVLAVAPGDVLLMASDGIVDQRRPDGDPFGVARLIETVGALDSSSAPGAVEAIFESVTRFAGGVAQDDDQTALVVRIGGTT